MPAPARPLLTAGKLPPDAHAPAVIEFVDTFHSSVRAAPPVPAKPIAVVFPVESTPEPSSYLAVVKFCISDQVVPSQDSTNAEAAPGTYPPKTNADP